MATPVSGSTPTDRYGASSRARRIAMIAFVAALAAAFLAWLVWAALDHARDTVSARLTSFSVISPHAVRVTFEVDGADGDAVVCTVEARAEDHVLVGSRDVAITADAAAEGTFETTLRTEREATTASVGPCRR